MKIENIDVTKTIEKVQNFIAEDKTISPAVKAMFELLLTIVNLLINKFALSSRNSIKPPSSDPNRIKQTRKKSDKKSGGQNGHQGTNLKTVDDPDQIVELKIDRDQLPKGKYTEVGYESRQVFDIKISRHVTEYRAQILQDEKNKQYVANFSGSVGYKVQYGRSVKAHSVYMSVFQMIPYNRIADYFADQMKIPLSLGSIFNFNQDAYEKLESFEQIVKRELIASNRINADETGINIGGKRQWLHVAANDLWVHFYPHNKRGSEAMNEAGILSNFKGVMCHDHWAPYYIYNNCQHSLCNAHHLRELQNVIDVNNHKWAAKMQEFLRELNQVVIEAGGKISKEEANKYRQLYRRILSEGNLETPEPPPIFKKDGTMSKKGPKKPKHRNLLERLQNFENDVLRFMEEDFVPFTNNIAENDLRMIKVQQKISGCFRSMEGAKIFCRVRSYLLTCQKHDISPTKALNMLFSGNLPNFCQNSTE